MDEFDITKYVEPIFRFCCKRLSDRYDAEDLAAEIICHILDGMSRYQIGSLDAWVWRVAHNRYARFIDRRNKNQHVSLDEAALLNIADVHYDDGADADEQRYREVFRYLHTLCAEYRNIFVDYYISELSVKALAEKYSLPETTVKWRLNIGRRKIRDRIGEGKMDKVYQRINWNTETCNGNTSPNRYLGTQLARAICLAAYEKPVTVEEISMSTGIPTMYIEDELGRLEYGEAIRRIGNKYAADFILFRLSDRKKTEGVSENAVKRIADKLAHMLSDADGKIREMDFYGSDFGIERLGYIIVPFILRRKIQYIKNNRLKLENGPYPLRKDGTEGWFIVEETVDTRENVDEYNSGCNVAGDDSGSCGEGDGHIYYYWTEKHFDSGVYHNRGTRWMCANGIVRQAENGILPEGLLSDEDMAHLISNNLAVKTKTGYRLNFACFDSEQFKGFISLFDMEDAEIDGLLAEWIMNVRKGFEGFVPKRLHGQINQWVNCYCNRIVAYVTDGLIARGVLRRPDGEKPLTDGVFYVEGKYIEP